MAHFGKLFEMVTHLLKKIFYEKGGLGKQLARQCSNWKDALIYCLFVPSLCLKWRWCLTCLPSQWRRWLQSVPVMLHCLLQKKSRLVICHIQPFYFDLVIFRNMLCLIILSLSNQRRRTKQAIYWAILRRRQQIRSARDDTRRRWRASRSRRKKRDRNLKRPVKLERTKSHQRLKSQKTWRNSQKEAKPRYSR